MTTVTFGNGNQTITVGSNLTINVGNGNDTITIGSNDVLHVGNGNDKITAGSSDHITVGNGNETISAGNNSTVTVGNGNDTVTVGASSSITTGNGNMILTAGDNSIIVSGNGNHTVVAGAHDQITIGNGNATISLGASDTAHVGNGNATFIFETPSTPTLAAPPSLMVNEDSTVALPISVALPQFGFGQDLIFGFSSASDKLEFATSQFANAAAVLADATQVGQNTIITADGSDTITLENTHLSSLSASNFVFLNKAIDPISVTISGLPSDIALSDNSGPLTVVGGSITLTQAQLAGLQITAGNTDETATLTVTATDTVSGNSVSQTIALSVVPNIVVNPDTAHVFDTAAADNGQIVAFGDAISDVGDSPSTGGTTLSVTAVNGSAANVDTFVAGTYGSLFLDSSGFYFYQANAIDQLQQGQNPTDQFTFTVADDNGHSKSTTLTFDINGANDNPVITAANAFGSIVEGLGPTVAVNGGFETGDLTGWSASGPDISVQPFFIGGAFGEFSALLGPMTGPDQTLSQSISTVAGQHYVLDFFVSGDFEASTAALTVDWNGSPVLALSNNFTGGFTEYSFDVVGAAGTTPLAFSYHDDGVGMLLDQVSVSPSPGPTIESTSGTIAFSDAETADTHTASFAPQLPGYVGTFSLDPVSESSGSGSLAWNFTVDSADIAFLTAGQVITQDYNVTIADNHGGTAVQDVTVAIHGPNPSNNNVTINGGETVELPTAYGGSATFASSTGTLQLDTSTGFTGTVSGLSGADTLDLRDINPAFATTSYSGDTSSGMLQVTDGTNTANIRLLGDYTLSTFVASDDGFGGTSVVDPIANIGLLANHMASAFATGSGSSGGTPAPASTQPDPVTLTQPQHG